MSNNPGVIRLGKKDYYTVGRRVADFRLAHSIGDLWAITTTAVEVNAERVMFKATITSPTGEVVATGYAEEVRSDRGVNSTSAVENCESSAIGRALAAAGFGGDGEYASADELTAALSQQPKKRGHAPTPANDADRREFAGVLKEKMGLDAAGVMAWLVDIGEKVPVTTDDLGGLYKWLEDGQAEVCREWLAANR